MKLYFIVLTLKTRWYKGSCVIMHLNFFFCVNFCGTGIQVQRELNSLEVVPALTSIPDNKNPSHVKCIGDLGLGILGIN